MKPLVSCICVTANRRKMIGAALTSYQSQDWPNKELVIVDDGDPDVRDLCAEIPGAVYMYVAGPQKIGPKRNLACQAASGEIIANWDDDDWSCPTRITDQVTRLLESAKAVSGYHSMLFWDGKQGFKYHGGASYSLGSALCYTKEFWRRHPFVTEDKVRFEDNTFVQAARTEQQIIAVDGGSMMVARIHAGNTSPKKPELSPQQWKPIASEDFPANFFVDIGTAPGFAEGGLITHDSYYLVGEA